MSKTKTKRYLVLLAAIGLVAAALGGTGTFASFNAEVTNAGNTFATGSLILNDNGGTTTCTSAGDVGNLNNGSTNGCDTLFTVPSISHPTATLAAPALVSGTPVTVLNFGAGGLSGGAIDIGDTLTVTSGSHTATFQAAGGADIGDLSVAVTSHDPGDNLPVGSTITDSSNTQYAKLTLTNAGTLDARDILFTMSACSPGAAEGNSTLTTALSAGVSPGTLHFAALTGSFHTGDPIVVSDGAGHTQTFISTQNVSAGALSVTVATQLANFSYPAVASTTVSGPSFGSGNLCNNLKLSIVETDSSFDHSSPAAQGCAYGTPGNAPLGCVFNSGTVLSSVTGSIPLNLASGFGGNTLTNLSAGQSRYFLLAVKQSGGFPDNTYQNRKASFDLTWHIDQA